MKAREYFELRSDGNGLSIRYREGYAVPKWVLRYSLQGKTRVLVMGSYADLSLAAPLTKKSQRQRHWLEKLLGSTGG